MLATVVYSRVLLLSGGPGLLDPCEKEHVDAVASLSLQQREDITTSAQVKCLVISIFSTVLLLPELVYSIYILIVSHCCHSVLQTDTPFDRHSLTSDSLHG